MCSKSTSEFRRQLLSEIHQNKNCVRNIYDMERIKILKKSCFQSSALNEHRLRHELNDANSLCNCGRANKDNKNFFLHCPLFYNFRVNLHGELSEFLSLKIPKVDDNFFCSLLRYGSAKFPYIKKRMILEA